MTKAHGMDSGQYTFSYVAGWADRALAAAPAGTTVTDIVSQARSRVIHAADTILATTKPTRSSDHLTQTMTTRVEQTIAIDQATTLTTRDAGVASAAKRARPVPPPGSARPVSSVSR